MAINARIGGRLPGFYYIMIRSQAGSYKIGRFIFLCAIFFLFGTSGLLQATLVFHEIEVSKQGERLEGIAAIVCGKPVLASEIVEYTRYVELEDLLDSVGITDRLERRVVYELFLYHMKRRMASSYEAVTDSRKGEGGAVEGGKSENIYISEGLHFFIKKLLGSPFVSPREVGAYCHNTCMKRAPASLIVHQLVLFPTAEHGMSDLMKRLSSLYSLVSIAPEEEKESVYIGGIRQLHREKYFVCSRMLRSPQGGIEVPIKDLDPIAQKVFAAEERLIRGFVSSPHMIGGRRARGVRLLFLKGRALPGRLNMRSNYRQLLLGYLRAQGKEKVIAWIKRHKNKVIIPHVVF